MKNIKNIVVTTDFSKTSRNAYRYAEMLAETLNAAITVLHIKEPQYPPSEFFPIQSIAALDDETLNKKMKSFVENEDSETAVMVKTKVESKIVTGKVIEEITHYSQRNDVDLIVMGTTGYQDFVTKIIGTVSLDVANKAHCPVVLVPRDATWQPINRIMFAANYASVLPTTISEIIDFAELLDSNIHFVHVNKHLAKDDDLMEKIWDELFEASDPRVAFEIYNINSGDVVEQLKKYATDHNIDLIAFVNKKRNFWQKLMHHSVTQNIVISIDKPMLILHFDD